MFKFTRAYYNFIMSWSGPRAETCIAYAKEDESLDDYLLIDELSFSLFLERNSLDFIKDAVVDYSPDKFGGTLTIKAPNAKLPQIKENASIEEKINYVIQINGKKRALILSKRNISENDLVDIINKEEKLKKYLSGKQIKKKIFVPNKLINIIFFKKKVDRKG